MGETTRNALALEACSLSAGGKVFDLVVQERARTINRRETVGQKPTAEGTAMSFPIPANEPQRLAALRALDILDCAGNRL